MGLFSVEFIKRPPRASGVEKIKLCFSKRQHPQSKTEREIKTQPMDVHYYATWPLTSFWHDGHN